MKKILYILAGAAFLFCGCAGPSADSPFLNLHDIKSYFAGDPFSDFYYDLTGGVNIAIDPDLDMSATPKLYQGLDEKCDPLIMTKKGYVLIGYSLFQANEINLNDALQQAQDVHAAIALLYAQHSDAINDLEQYPFIPEGTKGNESFVCPVTGTVPIRTYGDRVTYVSPRSTPQDCLVTYWVKLKPLMLGIQVKELSAEMKKTSPVSGVLVQIVIEGSPAFQAGIQKGDILMQIEDTAIGNVATFTKTIPQYADKQVTMVLYRDGEMINKTVTLNKTR